MLSIIKYTTKSTHNFGPTVLSIANFALVPCHFVDPSFSPLLPLMRIFKQKNVDCAVSSPCFSRYSSPLVRRTRNIRCSGRSFVGPTVFSWFFRNYFVLAFGQKSPFELIWKQPKRNLKNETNDEKFMMHFENVKIEWNIFCRSFVFFFCRNEENSNNKISKEWDGLLYKKK